VFVDDFAFIGENDFAFIGYAFCFADVDVLGRFEHDCLVLDLFGR
jgi:hypothetical protein